MNKLKEKGITLIALVISAVVLLILTGIAISLIVGQNGVLTQASSSIIVNRSSKAREAVTMAWSGVTTKFWTEWAQNSSKVLKDYFTLENLAPFVTADGEITEVTDNEDGTWTVKYVSNDQKIIYTYVINKAGEILSESQSEPYAQGDDDSLINLPTLSSIVNVGDYVNLCVGYVDRATSVDYTTPRNIKKAWRVLYCGDDGLITLISTGHPLKFYHESSVSTSLSLLNKVTTEPIELVESGVGYTENGFETNDIVGLFSNKKVFSKVEPVRYNVKAVGVGPNTKGDVEITGKRYIVATYMYWPALGYGDGTSLYQINEDGRSTGHQNYNGNVRLVVTLNSDVKVLGGEGSEVNPYKLGGIDYPEEPLAFTDEGRNLTSSNRTLSGETELGNMAYRNPVIPQGFIAIDTEEAKWSYLDGYNPPEVRDWNNGLVIEDIVNHNQFVWVPCSIENSDEVAKYGRGSTINGYTSVVSVSDANDSTTIGGKQYKARPVTESTQIGKYGGFYVARYEAGLASATQSTSTNNVYTEIPLSKEGSKIWNYVDYTHSYVAAQKMINGEIFGNTQSGLITGSQWDTIMNWFTKSGIRTGEKSEMNNYIRQNWGTYKTLAYSYSGNQENAFFTYGSSCGGWENGAFTHNAYGSTQGINADYPAHYHASGLNTNGFKKNIADLGGNVFEWSSMACVVKVNKTNYECRVFRGGDASSDNNLVGARYASCSWRDRLWYTDCDVRFPCCIISAMRFLCCFLVWCLAKVGIFGSICFW